MANFNPSRLICLGLMFLMWGCSGNSASNSGEGNIAKSQELSWLDDHTWYLPGVDGLARTYRFSTGQRRVWVDEWMSFPNGDAAYEDGKRVLTTPQMDQASSDAMVLCRFRTSAQSLSIKRGDVKSALGFYLMEARIQDVSVVPDAGNSPECETLADRFVARSKVPVKNPKDAFKIRFHFGKRLNKVSGRAGFVLMEADTAYFEKWNRVHPDFACLNINGMFSSEEDVENDVMKVFNILECKKNDVKYTEAVIENEATKEEVVVNVDGEWKEMDDTAEATISEYQIMSRDSLFVSRRVTHKKDSSEDRIREILKLNEWGDLVFTREVNGVHEFEKILFRQKFI